MLRIAVIEIRGPSRPKYQVFDSVQAIAIDRRNKCDLVIVAADRSKIIEATSACCRLLAMGYKSAVMVLNSKKTSRKALGVSFIPETDNIEGYIAHSDIAKIDRNEMLLKIYGPILGKVLLTSDSFDRAKKEIESMYEEPWSIVLAGAEVNFSFQCAEEYQTSPLDKIMIDKLSAIPIFLTVMYALFFFSIVVGGHLQRWLINAMHFLTDTLDPTAPTGWLHHLYQAATGGIETVASFVPLLGCLYLFLSFLEKSGYMARATRMVDSIVSKIGLSSRTFVPLITGFGCNVPTIISMGSIHNRDERITTVMMAPFMACSARLSVFVLLSEVFFANHGYAVVFLLYITGIVVAILTALIFKSKTTTKCSNSSLPPLSFPNPINVFQDAASKTYTFVTGAGKMICILFMAIYLIKADPSNIHKSLAEGGVIVRASKYIVPLFAPMGVKEDNWPAVAAVATGAIAKESIVGTMNAIYGDDERGEHEMRAKFDGQLGAFSYLLFILLYFPCASVFITIAKQLNYRWAIISMLWSNFIAYTMAVTTYQVGTFYIESDHKYLILSTIALTASATIAAFLLSRSPHASSKN